MAPQRQASQRPARTAVVRRGRDTTAQSVPAAEFKANCLSLLERVRQSRQPIIVTKHGRPVAKVVPLPAQRRAIFGFSTGSVKISGDIIAPTGARWDADAD